MVTKYLTWLIILFCPIWLSAKGVQIEVEVDSELASENQPIIGKIAIAHPTNEKVDENSFELEGSPLDVQLLSEDKHSSITIINGRRKTSHHIVSHYYFEIQGQKKGKHKLSPISVQVGQARYSTKNVQYEIHAAEPHSGFSLERYLETPMTLYPGQRFVVGYRLFLKTQIEVIRESFPLFDPPGFNKIGERKVRQYRRGGANVFEFSQELEAQSAGSFDVGESFIEGLAYQEDFFSRRIYKKPKLRAKAKPLCIVIKDFPIENRPHSFEGAVGKFLMHVELISASDLCVGDKLELKIAFRGEGLETLKLPHFSKQADFKNNFRFSDLPPIGKQIGNAKVFHLELRPLNDRITEIPPLAFSYFDPKEESYHTLKSSSIPLTIQALPSLPEPVVEEKVQEPTEALHENRPQSYHSLPKPTPRLIEITGVFPLSDQDFEVKKATRFHLEQLFFLLLLIPFQIWLKRKMAKEKSGDKKSHEVFKQAFKHPNELQKYHALLEKAFEMKFKEKGSDPKHPLSQEVENFLQQLQLDLFSREQNFDFKKSQREAQRLFKAIGGSS